MTDLKRRICTLPLTMTCEGLCASVVSLRYDGTADLAVYMPICSFIIYADQEKKKTLSALQALQSNSNSDVTCHVITGKLLWRHRKKDGTPKSSKTHPS